MRPWLGCALWIALLAALCPAVRAQPATTLYDEVLAEAIRAHQARDWTRAREQFERAYALYPNARALRGIGVAAFEDGQYSSAIRALEAALQHPERPLPDDLRELTRLLIGQARARVGLVRVERSPPDALVFVDGAAAVFEPDGGLLLDPGVHELRVEAAGWSSR
jgi:tetratricopeptide (TPR) repeat protein